MTEAADLLWCVRERIATEDRWCNDKPLGRDGDRVCLLLAFAEVFGEPPRPSDRDHTLTARDAAQAITAAIGTWRWAEWNDNHSHAEVITALDQAISKMGNHTDGYRLPFWV